MIGVLDWGIGGHTALAHARTRCPDLDAVYLSDSANTPYGLQDRRTLRRSVRRAIEVLRDQGATTILVACHSASTVLPDLDLPDVHGVIAPMAVPGDARRVLVLGGRRTIRSGAWRRALHGARPQATVLQRIAQPLSARVEAGLAGHPETDALVERIVAPARDVDVVVLACTHYAALSANLWKHLPHARLIDPAVHVVDHLTLEPGSGRIRWIRMEDS